MHHNKKETQNSFITTSTIMTGIGERESNKMKKEVEWKGKGGGGEGVKRKSIHKRSMTHGQCLPS